MNFENIFGSRKRIKLLVTTTNKNIEEMNVELYISNLKFSPQGLTVIVRELALPKCRATQCGTVQMDHLSPWFINTETWSSRSGVGLGAAKHSS
jgi:hypothetical protein